LFFITIALSANFPSFSQNSSGTYYEAGITVGPMVFLGDLGGHFGKGTTFIKDYNMNATKLSFGAYVAAHPSEFLGFRLAINFGKVEGDDAYIKGKGGLEEARFDRHLDFKSNIIEGFLAAEIYPTALLEDDPSSVMGRLRPYGVIGIGVFHFNPQGSYIDPNTGQATWVYLRPLHTEGQGFPEYPDRKEYGLTQLNIPLGVGIKYYISQNVNLSLELIHRKTFTDYIDDVSTTYVDPSLFYAHLSPSQAQIADAIYNKSPLRTTDPINYGPGAKRGDTRQKDAYFTLGFKLGIRITSDREWRNSTRCPSLRF
jgi:hypothetical protein